MNRTVPTLLACAWLAGAAWTADGAERPNVLFIAVDDLNHWVGHLGRNPQTKTPHIDRLAKMGVTWEEATRAPFIWVVPGLTRPGGVCERPVDFMSIYPTLCELGGVPLPTHVEGVSIRKLLADPRAEWNLPAVTTHGFQNHAVRTERWRYIRYANGDEELYDHANDQYEFINLARRSAEYDAVKAELARAFPKVNRPPLEARPAGGEEADANNSAGGPPQTRRERRAQRRQQQPQQPPEQARPLPAPTK